MGEEPTSEWLERPPSLLDQNFLAALGAFVQAFAGAESMLHRLLVSKSGLTTQAAAALLSGLRMKSAMDELSTGYLRSKAT